MIDVSCSQCGAVYHSEEAHVEKQLRCVRCGCLMSIVRVERAVFQHASALPHTFSPRSHAPPVERVNRCRWRIWALSMAVAVIVFGATAFVLVRHLGSRVANLSNIDQKVFPQNQGLESQQSENFTGCQHVAGDRRRANTEVCSSVTR